MALKFFYNGIKASDGNLQKATIMDGTYRNRPAGTLAVYAKSYRRFSAEIAEAFAIKNDSDSMTDYFETDHFYVEPSHPLYPQVKAAFDKKAERWAAKQAKREAEIAARRAA